MELSFDNAANVSTIIDTSLIFATREELDAKADKADLDKKADLGEDGKVVPEQLPQLGAWRRVFEVEQWDDEDGALHIPKTEHGMTPTEKYTMSASGWTGRLWTTTETPPLRVGWTLPPP